MYVRKRKKSDWIFGVHDLFFIGQNSGLASALFLWQHSSYDLHINKGPLPGLLSDCHIELCGNNTIRCAINALNLWAIFCVLLIHVYMVCPAFAIWIVLFSICADITVRTDPVFISSDKVNSYFTLLETVQRYFVSASPGHIHDIVSFYKGMRIELCMITNLF